MEEEDVLPIEPCPETVLPIVLQVPRGDQTEPQLDEMKSNLHVITSKITGTRNTAVYAASKQN